MARLGTLLIIACLFVSWASAQTTDGPDNVIFLKHQASLGPTVGINVYLKRSATPKMPAPSVVVVQIKFDPKVISPIFLNGSQVLTVSDPGGIVSLWYRKGANASSPKEGEVWMVISGGQNAITTYDDQRPAIPGLPAPD